MVENAHPLRQIPHHPLQAFRPKYIICKFPYDENQCTQAYPTSKCATHAVAVVNGLFNSTALLSDDFSC